MKRLLFITITIIAASLGFNTGSVFADSPADIVHVFDSTNTSNFDLCDNTGSTSCTGYSYLHINYNNGSTSNYYFNLQFTTGSTWRQYVPKSALSYVISLPTDTTRVSFNDQNLATFISEASGNSVTFTLSASMGCPVCPTCPEQLDPNRSPVMDDFHKVFINTMLSIIPITAIVFVVWFFIDMLSSLVFGRGK